MRGYLRRGGRVAALLLLLGWIAGAGYADGAFAFAKNAPEAAERFGDVHWYEARGTAVV